ncbi:MAG: hypothetical protein ACJ8EL_11185 [Rhizomicrobium sp.]
MSNKVPMLLAAVIFLIAAAGGLYRLMVGFPIIIGGVPIGQTASFFTFVICASLSIIFFKAALVRT